MKQGAIFNRDRRVIEIVLPDFTSGKLKFKTAADAKAANVLIHEHREFFLEIQTKNQARDFILGLGIGINKETGDGMTVIHKSWKYYDKTDTDKIIVLVHRCGVECEVPWHRLTSDERRGHSNGSTVRWKHVTCENCLKLKRK